MPEYYDPKNQPDWEATSPNEFKRARQGVKVTLRSTGRKVVMRSVQLVRFLAKGEIPNHLTPIAAALIWGAREAEPDQNITVKDLALEYSKLMDWVVEVALLLPRVTETGDEEDAIHITDLDPDEIQEIYDLATHPAKMLYPFRAEQDRDVEPVQDGAGGLPGT